MSMLYTGAFLDMWPIIRYGLWISHFIYTDGLPDSKYFAEECHGYKFCKDKETMIQSILDSIPGGCIEWKETQKNVYDFTLRNGIRLTYIMNTLTKDLHAFADILQPVTSLYAAGYTPSDLDIKLIPGLQKVFATALVECDLPAFNSNVEYIEIGCTESHDDTQGITMMYHVFSDCGNYDTLI